MGVCANALTEWLETASPNCGMRTSKCAGLTHCIIAMVLVYSVYVLKRVGPFCGVYFGGVRGSRHKQQYWCVATPGTLC